MRCVAKRADTVARSYLPLTLSSVYPPDTTHWCNAALSLVAPWYRGFRDTGACDVEVYNSQARSLGIAWGAKERAFKHAGNAQVSKTGAVELCIRVARVKADQHILAFCHTF